MNDDIIKVVPHKRILYAAMQVKYNWFKFKHENLVYQQTIVDNTVFVRCLGLECSAKSGLLSG